MADQDSIDILTDPVNRISCRKCGRHLFVAALEPFSKVVCPDCHTEQTVPVQLGQFLLLELLGKGGMGAVYRALDQELGRYVAIKVMRSTLGDDPQFTENFLREARAAAALNHRNVVQIYSCGKEKGQPYIVMELVSGGRLDEMIAHGEPLDEARTLEIGIDVAEGLKAANDIGLIHGDIKPANILFDKNQVAKVADFGLARFVKWQQAAQNEVWGTPYYIAPEKARGQKVDQRSDIYSLGATLYHALGAKPPFEGETATDVIVARLKNSAIGLRVIRPELQPETADVIARTLESDPFTRYPTYVSLLADLREALRIVRQGRSPLGGKARKSPAMLIGVTVAVVIALTIVVTLVGLKQSAARREKALLKPMPVQTLPERVVADQPAAQPEQPKAVIPPAQPFDSADDQAIVAAVQQWVGGRPGAMRALLQPVYEKVFTNGVGGYWIRLFQAVAWSAENNDQEANKIFQEIRGTAFEPVGGQPHPGNMPRAIARYMLAEMDEIALLAEATRWPPWCGELARFFMGVDYLKRGAFTRAADAFANYLFNQSKDPAWPYSLQPVAQLLKNQMAELNSQKTKNSKLVKAKQYAAARDATEAVKSKTSAILLPFVEKELANIRKAEEKEAGAPKQAVQEQETGGQDIQGDFDRLDEVRTANLSLVTQKDYRKAVITMINLLPQIKTEQGRQLLANYREAYERMDSLKKYLITRISAAPYRPPPGGELKGDAVGADLNGIRVALGQVGEMMIPWDQVSIRLYLQLANYYLADTSLPVTERAEATLNTAVFCYENSGFKTAATYAQQALTLNPELKVTARKLMPDILTD